MKRVASASPRALLTSVGRRCSCAQVLTEHDQLRSTARTDCNEHSSRSHTIFQVRVRVENPAENPAEAEAAADAPSAGTTTESVINFVDLAGSESAEEAGTAGDTRTEGIFINKSLLHLRSVIKHLLSTHEHVPYRNSKLTMLLKAALVRAP